MIASYEQFLQIYLAIKTEFHLSNGEKKVHIFVSTLEADSVCAFKILARLLANDGLNFCVYPVSSYNQIKQLAKTLPSLSAEGLLTNVVMINCGGQEDSRALMKLSKHTRLVIIDSRRPLHLKHIHAPLHLVVALSAGEEMHFSQNALLPKPADTDLESSEDEEGALDGLPGQKRRRQERDGDSREARRKRKREADQQRAEYYGVGVFWARPATLSMLQLAQDLDQEDKAAYWLAAVALADHYVHQRISMEKYRECSDRLHDQIANCEITDERRITLSVDGDDQPTQLATAKIPITRIEPVEDLVFPLMRHWNLYDAMVHCPYVGVRLQTFTEKGRRILDELLAKMGFRPSDCKLSHGLMPQRIARNLKARLAEKANQYRLNNLWINTFHLHWGYREPLSAIDAAYLITALLESHLVKTKKPFDHREAFWRAVMALDPRNDRQIEEGIELAKKLQKAVLADSSYLIANKGIHSRCNMFWFTDLSEASIMHRETFSRPMALMKLGMFLRDRQALASSKPSKAFVIFGMVKEDGEGERLCPVVCVPAKPKITDTEGNRIPLLLQEAAEKADCPVYFDGFDSAIGLVSPANLASLKAEMAICASRTLRI